MKRATLAMAMLAGLAGAVWADDGPTAAQLFEKRLLPIFKSPNPSSCVECHLAGVDLKNYILPSHEKTFVSLRDLGLIDLEKPEESKILKLITMGEAPGAALIKNNVRKAELEAFTAWIKASVSDPKLRDAPKLAPAELAKPKRPNEVIRHARADQVLASFERNVWSQRFRCTSCHAVGGAENAKLAKENGDEMTWIKAEGLEATMKFVVGSRMINPKAPEKSLLLLKPLNQVKHGGGQKMLPGDLTYKAFRTWLEDYARIVGDKYAKEADLPKEANETEKFGTDVWLKISDTPAGWADRLLQVGVFAWDAEKKAWEAEPVAVSDRAVFGKGKLWQHNLILQAASGSARAKAWKEGKPSLPQGRYLLRVYVDVQKRLERDWTSPLGKADFAGEAELESRWPAGYGSMTTLSAGLIKR